MFCEEDEVSLVKRLDGECTWQEDSGERGQVATLGMKFGGNSATLLLFLSRPSRLHPHPVLAHLLVEWVGCN